MSIVVSFVATIHHPVGGSCVKRTLFFDELVSSVHVIVSCLEKTCTHVASFYVTTIRIFDDLASIVSAIVIDLVLLFFVSLDLFEKKLHDFHLEIGVVNY